MGRFFFVCLFHFLFTDRTNASVIRRQRRVCTGTKRRTS